MKINDRSGVSCCPDLEGSVLGDLAERTERSSVEQAGNRLVRPSYLSITRFYPPTFFYPSSIKSGHVNRVHNRDANGHLGIP